MEARSWQGSITNQIASDKIQRCLQVFHEMVILTQLRAQRLSCAHIHLGQYFTGRVFQAGIFVFRTNGDKALNTAA